MKKLFLDMHKLMACGLILAIALSLSCKKIIEIPGNPPSQILREQQFLDSASTLSAVAGVYTYNTIASQGFPYNDASLTRATALSAHEVAYTGTGPYAFDQAFYNYTLNSLNTRVSSLWHDAYKAIYQVNDVLAGVSGNSHLSAIFVKQITGEMEFTRAFYYFNLVNLFGGVPLVTSIDYTLNAQLPRATDAEIYTQILTDLDNAIKKLPATYPSTGHARPNLYTALNLMAKVQLYRGQWQAAYNAADSVIKSGVYRLEPALSKVFQHNSPEAIWQLPVLSSTIGTAEASSYIPNRRDNIPDYPVTKALLDQFEIGDQRLGNWLGAQIIPSGDTFYYPAKYKDRLPDPNVDYMVFRLAEVYLIRAEAAAQLNLLSGALADVNILRTRAGLAASTADVSSQSAVLAAIRKERQTELCFEWGNSWFDLKRTVNDPKYPADSQAAAVLTGYKDFNALFPIPRTQLQLNTHLIQNPGYQ